MAERQEGLKGKTIGEDIDLEADDDVFDIFVRALSQSQS